MKKIRTVIVDDEEYVRDYLKSVIQERLPELEIVGIASNVNQSVEMIAALKPQLCLLDIDLKTGSGFDIIRDVKKLLTRMPDVVFITAYSQFMPQAFDYGVMGYILKNNPTNELVEKLRGVVKRIQERDGWVEELTQEAPNDEANTKSKIPIIGHRIIVPHGGAKIFVEINRLQALEGQGSQTKLYVMPHSQYIMSFQLNEFEKLFSELNEANIIRVHKSWIVNFLHVERMYTDKRKIILQAAAHLKIPIGDGFRKNLPGI